MGDREGGSFGRGLMNYVASKLPYSQPYDIIDDIQELNPKYKDFYKAGSLILKSKFKKNLKNSQRIMN